MNNTEKISLNWGTSSLCLSPLVFSDTICDLGGVDELANYGEYSGAPSEQQTYDYAKTILSLMTREKHPEGEDRLNHHKSWRNIKGCREEMKPSFIGDQKNLDSWLK